MNTIGSQRHGIRLLLPIDNAVSFSLGWSDLDIEQPSDLLRQVVGLLTIDRLEYAEQWRNAALLRLCLQDRWPELREGAALSGWPE
ncbi:MAG: hypothetical protein JO354_10230 [Verrucomicrobia bacterium]|nr:hypothetical protein [Verrucomicrobiota bacterium]